MLKDDGDHVPAALTALRFNKSRGRSIKGEDRSAPGSTYISSRELSRAPAGLKRSWPWGGEWSAVRKGVIDPS